MARPSVLAQLRALTPNRPLSLVDAQWVAERQATTLLRLSDISEPPVPEAVISGLPRVRVERVPMRPSGATRWVEGRWLILLKKSDRLTRQRYSLAHEYAHVLLHPFGPRLHPPLPGLSSAERIERVCEFFAASLLMPRVWVRRAWTGGLQDVPALAETFDVSRTAMAIRLEQLGLSEPVTRCATGVGPVSLPDTWAIQHFAHPVTKAA